MVLRAHQFVVLLALAMGLSACSKTGGAGANEPDIMGKWSGKIEMGQTDDKNPFAKMGEAFGSMLTSGMTLEFKPGDRFVFSMMGIPVEGKVVRKGLDLTLTPETAAGMTPDQMGKDGSKFGKEPMYAKIAPDGSKITMTEKDAKPDSGTMVFVRAKDEPKKETATTVAEGEKGIVGTYKAEVEGDIAPGKSDAERKMAEALVQAMELDLRSDNTFKLNMMFVLEGTWKAEGDKVQLHVTTALGMTPDKSSKNDDMVLKVLPDGKLEMQEKAGQQPSGPKMRFVKK